MTMTMTVNSPQSTTRVIKSTKRVGGQTRVINATTESKWLSASCDKK
jgi:Leucine-rich repeat (LRR) protein